MSLNQISGCSSRTLHRVTRMAAAVCYSDSAHAEGTESQRPFASSVSISRSRSDAQELLRPTQRAHVQVCRQ